MGVAEYDPYGPMGTPGRVARPPDVSFGYAHETSALESGASDRKQMAALVAAQLPARWLAGSWREWTRMSR